MDMEPELRKGADARLLLEVTLLQSMTSLTPAPAVVATVSVSPLPTAVKPADAGSEPEVGERQPAPAAAPSSVNAGSELQWEALRLKLPRPVSSLLMDARLAAVKDGVVRIEFRYPAHLEQMQKADKNEMLHRAALEVFGPEVRLELAAADKSNDKPAAAKPRASIGDDPVVKDAMNRFDAVNVRMVPKGR
jgi:hypothetical protein